MPRPNRPREVFAEEHLAKRIAFERDVRGWTNDGLAKRMTDAGCAVTGSAIFKIEKGEPRRRIVVDELVAFARVFDTTVEVLISDPLLGDAWKVAPLVDEWCRRQLESQELRGRANEIDQQADKLLQEVVATCRSSDEAADAVRGFFDQFPDGGSWGPRLTAMFTGAEA